MEEKKNILTYEGLRQYEEELHELKVVRRKEIAQKIKEAREQGDLSENAEYDAAKDEQRDVEARIEELKVKAVQTPDGQTKELEDRKAQIQERISKNQKVIQSAEIAKAMQGRVKELETNQRVCGERVAEVELMIGDVERFVMSRSRMLEDSINDLFPTVRWKLFDTQINGGVTDCCECMILCDGCTVPYSGANTASCVNADIEIIGVLEKHFDLTVPVFVDNAERVNHLTRPHGQLITLSVSDDLELRVETQTEREAA